MRVTTGLSLSTPTTCGLGSARALDCQLHHAASGVSPETRCAIAHLASEKDVRGPGLGISNARLRLLPRDAAAVGAESCPLGPFQGVDRRSDKWRNQAYHLFAVLDAIVASGQHLPTIREVVAEKDRTRASFDAAARDARGGAGDGIQWPALDAPTQHSELDRILSLRRFGVEASDWRWRLD